MLCLLHFKKCNILKRLDRDAVTKQTVGPFKGYLHFIDVLCPWGQSVGHLYVCLIWNLFAIWGNYDSQTHALLIEHEY